MDIEKRFAAAEVRQAKGKWRFVFSNLLLLFLGFLIPNLCTWLFHLHGYKYFNSWDAYLDYYGLMWFTLIIGGPPAMLMSWYVLEAKYWKAKYEYQFKNIAP